MTNILMLVDEIMNTGRTEEDAFIIANELIKEYDEDYRMNIDFEEEEYEECPLACLACNAESCADCEHWEKRIESYGIEKVIKNEEEK